MKCQKCDGTGKAEIGVGAFTIHGAECDQCNGKGIIEPMTNEEWLRSATFEEMAGTLYEWYSQGHIEGKVGKQLSSVTRVVEWLKQPHTKE